MFLIIIITCYVWFMSLSQIKGKFNLWKTRFYLTNSEIIQTATKGKGLMINCI